MHLDEENRNAEGEESAAEPSHLLAIENHPDSASGERATQKQKHDHLRLLRVEGEGKR